MWAKRIKAMIADGRITLDQMIEGKKLYKLDRKRLGMVEEDKPMPVIVPVKKDVDVELDDELKPKPVELKKTLSAAMKRMTSSGSRVKRVTPAIHG